MIGRRRRIEAKLDAILAELRATTHQGATTMGLIEDLQADVTAQTSVVQSAVTLLQGLSAQLAAAGTDPAKLSALKSQLDANTSALAAAVAANTPADADAIAKAQAGKDDEAAAELATTKKVSTVLLKVLDDAGDATAAVATGVDASTGS